LIGQRRLSVLPDLLEAGAAYCRLDKPRLNELVEGLEPKVRQLATVLSLNIDDSGGYTQVLLKAHDQMSRVAESVAGTLSQGIANEQARPIESEPHELHALALARQLRASFEEFFSQPEAERAAARPPAIVQSAASTAEAAYAPLLGESLERRRRPLAEQDDLTIRLTLAVGRCRAARQPLSLVLLAAEGADDLSPQQMHRLERLLETACQDMDVECEKIERPGEARRLLLLTGRDRLEAVAMARNMVEGLRRQVQQTHQAGLLPACISAAGVASVAIPAKNFRPMSMLETAERCLAAALASGGVKSLEVS
jgi:hypothetical protein